ncbi:PREDICTED: serine protease snake-like [Nicrophorus vespilloides]|uniref:Serine protease snake-like n=1 Tax=Nicrophorus vespilloides TaxID=110193 RepID=A0ABM1N9D5_NICVS|nr:PREDICTED: serine protease snake-like [Nicrophorus vespilloides]
MSFKLFCCVTLIILIIDHLNAQYKEGDNCTLRNGSKGQCYGIKDCEQAILLLLLHNKALKTCNTQGDTTLVCCGKRKIVGYRSTIACHIWNQSVRYIGGGGVDALPREYPHMAVLGYGSNSTQKLNWSCGGSLISEKFVLTAAHCLNHKEFGPVKYVRIGDLNLKLTNDSVKHQDFLVANTIKHPSYKRPSKYHDIALIELDHSVKITEDVIPACLNLAKSNPVQYAATGWGLLSFQGVAPDHLQKLVLNHVNNTECNKHFEVNARTLKRGIMENRQICAGYPGRDTCQGDSGGPLQTKNELGVFFIHGVTAFGKPCLLTSSPGVYTRVSNYLRWIEESVWPNNTIYEKKTVY